MEWIVLIVFLAVVSSIFNQANDDTKWFGYMICTSCHYRWTSRRNTPPSKCPNCNSRFISLLYGSNENNAYKKWLANKDNV